MARVTVEPSAIELDVQPGETIFAAALRSGFTWPTTCGGQGQCRACVLRVRAGAEATSPVSPYEREGLDEIAWTLAGPVEEHRLACQVRVTGDVVVHKRGVRPATGVQSPTS